MSHQITNKQSKINKGKKEHNRVTKKLQAHLENIMETTTNKETTKETINKAIINNAATNEQRKQQNCKHSDTTKSTQRNNT